MIEVYIPCWGGPCDGMLAPDNYYAFLAPGGWYYRTIGRGGRLFRFVSIPEHFIHDDDEQWRLFQLKLRSVL